MTHTGPERRSWTAETWAKVVVAVIGALTFLAVIISYGVTLKGDIKEARAAADLSTSGLVGPVEHRVTVIETDYVSHKDAQTKREETLDATLLDLRKAVEIVNLNVAVIGAKDEATKYKMKKLPSRPKDLKP